MLARTIVLDYNRVEASDFVTGVLRAGDIREVMNGSFSRIAVSVPSERQNFRSRSIVIRESLSRRDGSVVVGRHSSADGSAMTFSTYREKVRERLDAVSYSALWY